ncbi:MAG: putative ABC transporter permease subunit, partial [Romboutsia sp.]|uniref:putative ABC transporter permease subunit n=1 Tax=Romboutsia sp. TaxID=1965302 RepID=UPI003F314503
MDNLGLLMKTSIINEMGINKLKTWDKKEKSKMIAMILLIGGSIAILGVYGFGLCFYLADFLIEINQAELLLIIGVIGSAFATLFTCLYKASSYLFSSKDIEMLASLPIKQSTILSSKVLALIFNNYLFSSVFILIPAIVYFVKVDTSITYLPYLIILTLSTPLIPITISSILAFFITTISSKMKKNNIVLILLNILLLVGIMTISFNLQNVVLEIVQNSSSIIEATKKIYPPAYYFVDALKNNSSTSLIIFLIVSLVYIGIFVCIFSKNFNKINSQMEEKYKANNYEFIELKPSKPVTALLKKEAKRYFSSTIYFMNTFIGMILLPIFAIAIVFLGYDKITEILGISAMLEMIKIQITGMVVFCVIMTNTT